MFYFLQFKKESNDSLLGLSFVSNNFKICSLDFSLYFLFV